MIFSLTNFAQESTPVSGYFKENYRSLEISKQMQRVVFLKTGGNVILPRSAYYLNLIPADAKRLGLKDILVISSAGEDYLQNNTQLQKLNVARVSDLEQGLYLELANTKPSNQKMISILKNPTKTDTLNYNTFYNSNDFGLTKQWIDVIDNTATITVEGTMVAHLTNGESISNAVYDLIPIDEVAKKALHYVGNLFDLGDTEHWKRIEWQNWYEKILASKAVEPSASTASTFSIPDNYGSEQNNMAYFGTDEVSKKVLAIESLRYNVDNFTGHQIIKWDSAKVHKSDYYRTGQKQLFRVDAFKSLGSDLFVIGKYNTWTHLIYDQNTQQYNIQKQLLIALPKTLLVSDENEIQIVQMGEKLSYVVLKNKLTGSFFVLTLNTITGEVLFAKGLSELLPTFGENDLGVVNLKYGTEITDGFLFGLRNNKRYYLVKTTVDLTEARVRETTSMIQNSTAFTHANQLDIINLQDGLLSHISFNPSISQQNSEIMVTDFDQKYYDQPGVITHDGKNYQVFFSYSAPLHSGIKMYVLNHQMKPISARNIFNFLEIEEPMEHNLVHLLYTSKMEKHVWLFFKKGVDLHYTKVMETKN